MSTLLERATEIHKIAYKKEGMNRTKYKNKVFYFCQGLFGDKAKCFKDLDEDQLAEVIVLCEERIVRKGIKMPNDEEK